MSRQVLGYQVFIELYGCKAQSLRHVETVRLAVLKAAKRAKATIVTDLFHEFNPYGVSGVVVIAESHVAIHTWPEHGCVSVDIFSCSPKLSSAVVEMVLAKAFGAKQIERSERSVRLPAGDGAEPGRNVLPVRLAPARTRRPVRGSNMRILKRALCG